MVKFCYLRLYLDNETVLYLLLLWDGKDEVEPTFSGFNAMPVKKHQSSC